ncbi:TonB-linked outer membrane protein, SusC/RagA family [Pedobacter steynii]|uniref:TonB-linked outer membrane protein, SusC/RagA family n=1 Tax=Pedobacter steynii TaxID=430522 RepID=A0A1G9NER2_9SPHI|nr:TonB-dependent receptor [Pedobacter steynii]NQX39328.1 TonB-dependent receptor [Pedobacter steynii]SDL84781.1 TonB-linked outer membrane protein, SusC/RagA family [Pedobacter steynii]
MKLYYITLLLLFCSISIYAQGDIEVTGTVRDLNNKPIPGVTVVVKDRPGLGTMTTETGKYKIKTGMYSTLIFSYLGFEKQEVQVAGKTSISILLKESEANVLTDVVVTGTGIQKKVTVTGAITTVNVKDLRTPTGNITNALAGNVAGVIAMQGSGEPGNNRSEFWIRGISTFGANTAALVLVDGFERAFNEINVEDIESFSILKDASATAIYGSKGANGVVLITTKKGHAGKININGKSEFGYMTRTRTPEFVDGPTYAALVNEAKVTRNQEPMYSDIELMLFKNGLDPDLYPNVNWQDVMLRDGANTYRASVNLDGGGSTVRYYVSGSYFNEGGMYKSDQSLKDYNTNANMTRSNYRANIDMDITKTTLLKLGVSGFLEKQNFPGLTSDIWRSLVGQSPISTPILYSNGLVPAYGTGDRTNPWVMATQTGYREYWKNKNEINVTLEQKLDFITKGLQAIGRFAYDTNNDNNINRLKWPEQYNVERRRDRDGNLIMKRITPERLMFQESNAWGERINVLETDLIYNTVINGRHNIGALIKYNQREQRETSNVGGDIIKGIARRNMGVSGRLMYGYRDRYMAEFNFGYTGSENFKAGHQFGFFPAVSVGWNISEEAFLKNKAKWLDLFKVRYSYGEVGNDNFGNNRFPYLSEIKERPGYNFGESISPNYYAGLYYSQVASDQLTWEVAKKHNLGFDMNVLGNLFSFRLDVFKDTREKIFKRRDHLSAMVGVPSRPWANVGKMESRGFDGQFNFFKRINKVDFTLRGNVTYSKNKVLEFDEEANNLPYRMTQGFRYEQARGLVDLGLFQSYEEIRNSPKQMFGEYMPGDVKYKDVNGDGIINDDDVVPIGASRVPSMIYGFGFSVVWKGFDVNIHLQGAGSSSYFINGPSVYPFAEGGWGNVLTDLGNPKNRWISKEISGDPATENPNAKYPRLSYGGSGNNYRTSTYWLRDGAYLRLKNVELGYTLPSKLMSSIHVNKARVYVMGYNLAVWDSLKIWDPELGSGDGMRYPISKTITLGLNVNF